MAHINVNMNEAPDMDEVHPEGPLHVRVKEAKQQKNKDDDGQHIAWRLDPVGTTIKRPVWLRTSLKLENQGGLKSFLRACGFQWNADGSFNTDDVLGSELIVNVSVGEYNGAKTNEVKFPYKKVAA